MSSLRLLVPLLLVLGLLLTVTPANACTLPPQPFPQDLDELALDGANLRFSLLDGNNSTNPYEARPHFYRGNATRGTWERSPAFDTMGDHRMREALGQDGSVPAWFVYVSPAASVVTVKAVTSPINTCVGPLDYPSNGFDIMQGSVVLASYRPDPNVDWRGITWDDGTNLHVIDSAKATWDSFAWASGSRLAHSLAAMDLDVTVANRGDTQRMDDGRLLWAAATKTDTYRLWELSPNGNIRVATDSIAGIHSVGARANEVLVRNDTTMQLLNATTLTEMGHFTAKSWGIWWDPPRLLVPYDNGTDTYMEAKHVSFVGTNADERLTHAWKATDGSNRTAFTYVKTGTLTASRITVLGPDLRYEGEVVFDHLTKVENRAFDWTPATDPLMPQPPPITAHDDSCIALQCNPPPHVDSCEGLGTCPRDSPGPSALLVSVVLAVALLVRRRSSDN